MRNVAFALLLASCCLSATGRAADADHWAFRPVGAVSPPPVRDAAWVRNPIDAFIATRHEAHGLVHAPEADRRVLLRRVTLDLTGLPPTPEETAAFLADESPDAYEKVVDRLLASPAYGERWARHWLDLARWAESEGYESNHPRPYAWRYRDYVVRSFNADKPYDRFLTEQIAGDELTPYADENLIATGFLAAARLSSNEEDKARQRNDVLVDVVNATAATFLGLTLNCAQCHNHKFDPLSQRDYYRFQGFFVKGQPASLELRDPELWKPYLAARPPEYEPLRRLQEALEESTRQRLVAEARKGLSPETLAALDTPPERRTPEQERLADEADVKLQFGPTRIEKAIRDDDRTLYEEVKRKLAALDRVVPDRPQTFGFYSPATSPTKVETLSQKGFYPLPYVPAELARARPYLLRGGDVHRRGDALDVGWPAVFGPVPPGATDKTPRLALADWLTRPEHPLTARVWANRVWQYHFGKGIVSTPSDFGTRGSPPTHPELLDWLAGELVRSGWSTRHLHRLIVCSSTYRQSSQGEGNARTDPDNALLWRWTPRRLEAEAIRDVLLAVSAELDRTAGGPSDAEAGPALRRSLYLPQKRESPPPLQGQFDGPNAAAESCPRRQVSTVPLQALFLLNNEFAVQRGWALARRVYRTAGNDPDRAAETAFVLALGRAPDDRERELARRFFRADPPLAAEAGGPAPALARFCQALQNLNELLYLE
jgi:hypothetical protein